MIDFWKSFFFPQFKFSKFQKSLSSDFLSFFSSEILYEDTAFTQHKLAALVASKVYYHLGSFEDSLIYALGAGELFDVNARNEYVDTTIGKMNFMLTDRRPEEIRFRPDENVAQTFFFFHQQNALTFILNNGY